MVVDPRPSSLHTRRSVTEVHIAVPGVQDQGRHTPREQVSPVLAQTLVV